MKKYQKQLESFKVFIEQVCQNEIDYSKRLLVLNQMYSEAMPDFKESVDTIRVREEDPLETFFLFMQNKYILQEKLVESLKSNILTPVRRFITENDIQKHQVKIKELEKQQQTLLLQVEKTKNKYFSSMELVENAIYDYEMSQTTKISIDKYKYKMDDKIRFALENENEYKLKIDVFNRNIDQINYLNELISQTEEKFKIFQMYIFTTIINFFETFVKDGFSKILDLKSSLSKVLSSNLNSPNSDKFKLVRFIKFEEYVPKLQGEKEIDEEIYYKMLVTLKSTFGLKVGDKKALEAFKKELEFKRITSHIIDHCASLTKQEKTVFKDLLKEKVFAEQFVQALIPMRMKQGLFKEEGPFKFISEIFCAILDNYHGAYKDDATFEIAKNILLLAQSFYKTENNKKVYVEQALKDNKLLKDEEFWKGFFQSVLTKIANNQEEKNEKAMKEMLFMSIFANIGNLCEFFSSKEVIINIISEVIINYNFSEEQIEKIKNEVASQIKS